MALHAQACRPTHRPAALNTCLRTPKEAPPPVQVFIVAFNALYRAVALRLTAWENHRTESDHENSLILQSFSFQARA